MYKGPLTKIRMLALILLGLALAGCTELEVFNASEQAVRVQVHLPDRARAYYEYIPPNFTDFFISGSGGAYSVRVVPDEAYRQRLLELRDKWQIYLVTGSFEPGATVSDSQRRQIVDDLTRWEEELNRLSEQTAFCSGYLPEYESVTVVVTYVESEQRWSLSCP